MEISRPNFCGLGLDKIDKVSVSMKKTRSRSRSRWKRQGLGFSLGLEMIWYCRIINYFCGWNFSTFANLSKCRHTTNPTTKNCKKVLHRALFLLFVVYLKEADAESLSFSANTGPADYINVQGKTSKFATMNRCCWNTVVVIKRSFTTPWLILFNESSSNAFFCSCCLPSNENKFNSQLWCSFQKRVSSWAFQRHVCFLGVLNLLNN